MPGIRITERCSGLSARYLLLHDSAPATAALLANIAADSRARTAIHGMWTGPEISCPINAATLPFGIDPLNFPMENQTSHPHTGDIGIVVAPCGHWAHEPRFDLIDIGIFYDSGARLLLPMGWIAANICAQVVAEDMAPLKAAAAAIRRNGTCNILIEPWP